MSIRRFLSLLRRGFILPCVGLMLNLPLIVFPNTSPTSSESQLRSSKTLQRLAIYPADALLGSRHASQRLVVQGYYADGYSEDLTAQAKITTADPKLVKINSAVISPLASGSTTITASIGTLSATTKVTARDIEQTPQWSFRNHVIPVLTKAGCNMGACHGAAAGKNGFKLTLRGYDPEVDYKILTREAVGRRISAQDPGHSLVLLKPTLLIPHAGGRRFGADSLEYRVIAEWISEGTRPPSPEDRRIEKIAVEPRALRLRTGSKQQLLVTAHFNDGYREDVTEWVRFESTNAGTASVDEHGRVELKGAGEAGITTMYLSKVDVASMAVPFPNNVSEAAFSSSQQNNYIDKLVLDKLRALNIEPSGLSTDGEFIRRAYLDATGTLPSAGETEEFLASKGLEKRQKLIEKLLNSEAYVDYWAYKWSDLLLVTVGSADNAGGNKLTPGAVRSFYNWVRDSVDRNKPWNQMVREMYTATGSSRELGALNFYQLHKDPIRLTENTTVAFMGLRLTCARCHNHPLEKYTQVDYYKMANLFARVHQKAGDTPGEIIVYNTDAGDISHPRLNKPLPPAPLEGQEIPLDAAGRRELLADWLTSPDNQSFSRTIVNRVWANFMGRGLVDPVDDLRSTNPPSNEPLMKAVVEDFVKHGYDIKRLAGIIMNSATYQRTWQSKPTNVNDDRYYSHYLLKRLPAEVMLDAMSQVTGIPTPFEDFPPGTRALQLPDTNIESYFLDAFGRPDRATTCECERDPQPNLRQALHMINGDTLNKKLSASGSLTDKAAKMGMPDSKFVEHLYLTALSRYPTELERAKAIKSLQEAGGPDRAQSRKETLEDFAWAVLTGKEFIFNH
jgi:Protein of unknown function (DUF1553)/Protein of unknown function (DUF1549)